MISTWRQRRFQLREVAVRESRWLHEKARSQRVEGFDSLRQNILRIVTGSDPESGIERGTAEESGGRFRVNGLEGALCDEALHCPPGCLKTTALAGPLRRSPNTAGPSSRTMRWTS